jgi:hypothetical protein
MKLLSRLLLAPTLAAVLLLACTPTNAAVRASRPHRSKPQGLAFSASRK